MNLTNDQAHHIDLIDEAKAHLGMVAPELRAGLARYLELGIEPGAFLCAVLDNDLSQTIARCSNFAILPSLCSWLYNYAPPKAHGSKEKRLDWQARVSVLAESRDEEHVERDTDHPPSVDLGPIEDGKAAE